MKYLLNFLYKFLWAYTIGSFDCYRVHWLIKEDLAKVLNSLPLSVFTATTSVAAVGCHCKCALYTTPNCPEMKKSIHSNVSFANSGMQTTSLYFHILPQLSWSIEFEVGVGQ